MEKKKLNRWMAALGIAKCLFENDGYHTVYLEEIEVFIKRDFRLIKNLRKHKREAVLIGRGDENGSQKQLG